MDNQQPSLAYKEYSEDNNYLIYENGEIYSKKSNKFLKGKIGNTGYKEYALAIGDNRSANGKKKSKMVLAHRLVAEAFIPNPDNLPYVNHKDENKLNNNINNLEWISSSENALYSLPNRGQRGKAIYLKDNLIEDEKWCIIKEAPNYSISDLGRVINNKTKRLLKIDDSQTYSRVNLLVNGCKKHFYIHRLVYCSFNQDYELDGFVIDHIDANSKNNKLNNLQKITQSKNCLKQERFNDYRKADKSELSRVDPSGSKCEAPLY